LLLSDNKGAIFNREKLLGIKVLLILRMWSGVNATIKKLKCKIGLAEFKGVVGFCGVIFCVWWFDIK